MNPVYIIVMEDYGDRAVWSTYFTEREAAESVAAVMQTDFGDRGPLYSVQELYHVLDTSKTEKDHWK